MNLILCLSDKVCKPKSRVWGISALSVAHVLRGSKSFWKDHPAPSGLKYERGRNLSRPGVLAPASSSASKERRSRGIDVFFRVTDHWDCTDMVRLGVSSEWRA